MRAHDAPAYALPMDKREKENSIHRYIHDFEYLRHGYSNNKNNNRIEVIFTI